jgi:hypothetical protein
MMSVHEKISRRQFIQLALGTALCLAVPVTRRAPLAGLSSPAVRPTGRSYGSGRYGRGGYGATAVYLPVVGK